MNNSNGTWWLRRIVSANSLGGLREAMVMISQRTGFRYFVFRGRYPQLLSDDHEVRLDNCPASWLDCRSERGLAAAPDLMHHSAMHEATPLLWRDWVPRYPDYFARARKLGLVTGVTHPVHGPADDRSSITFIKGVGGIQAEREILAALSECQLIACYVHGTVGRLIENRSGSADPGACPTGSVPTLTERERECLSWAATGKTAAEVATALSLSKTTVIYHLAKARHKLDAANSPHAITKAISMKLIASA